MTTTVDEVACAAHNAKPQPEDGFAVMLDDDVFIAFRLKLSNAHAVAAYTLKLGVPYTIRRATLTLGEVVE